MGILRLRFLDSVREHQAGFGIGCLMFFVWLPKEGDGRMTEKGKTEEESELAETGCMEAGE
jgi:hypothetical protein